MAGGTLCKTPHFVLHRGPLDAALPAGPGSARPQALFVVQDQPWMGAVVPKRWAKRAVTRNGIKRQIYNVSAAFEDQLAAAAHVVRLRMDFARAEFPSAWSEPLKKAVRDELVQLFGKAAAAQATAIVVPAKAGTQGSPRRNAEALDPRLRGDDGGHGDAGGHGDGGRRADDQAERPAP